MTVVYSEKRKKEREDLQGDLNGEREKEVVKGVPVHVPFVTSVPALGLSVPPQEEIGKRERGKTGDLKQKRLELKLQVGEMRKIVSFHAVGGVILRACRGPSKQGV